MSDKTDQMEQLLEQVLGLLEGRDYEGLREALQGVHASDLADLVEHLEDEERLSLVHHLPSDLAADALAEMEEVERPGELLLQLEPERAAEIVHEMADDDAADVIGEPSVAVFVPTVPNPTSGFLLFVPRRRVHRLEMTVEEGFKMILSAGMAVPESAQAAHSMDDR